MDNNFLLTISSKRFLERAVSIKKYVTIIPQNVFYYFYLQFSPCPKRFSAAFKAVTTA